MKIRVAVLMTCHNRCAKTVDSLRALYKSSLPVNWEIHVVLVDDGSTDGTSEKVSEEFCDVEILKGDGSLFWNRGMHWAFDHAAKSFYDFYIWLNDDTILFDDALTRLDQTYRDLTVSHGPNIVIVGSTRDASGSLSYGGSVSVSSFRRFQYRKVWHSTNPVECHVINGNLVLIPNSVFDLVGNVDYSFEHAMGDTDYGLRVRANGGRVFVAPGYLGECSNNPVEHTFKDQNLPLKDRWRHMTSRKGLPIKSWLHFTRTHGGVLWPIYFIWPYFKVIFFR